MSERLYDNLANVFMLIAVGSALLFDSASSWHVADGAVGIAAGVSAAVLYFKNQSRSAAEADRIQIAEKTHVSAVHSVAPRENWAGVGVKWELGTYRALLGDRWELGAYRRETLKGVRLYPHYQPTVARNRHTAYRPIYEDHVQTAQEEVVLSPNDVAACAIEIIRNLSSGDDRFRWQFSFGPEGLRVSEKNAQDRPEPPQEDLDFGQKSTMVN